MRKTICSHLYIHLNMEGNTEVDVEGLNTSCSPDSRDLLCKASSSPVYRCWIIHWMISVPTSVSNGISRTVMSMSMFHRNLAKSWNTGQRHSTRRRTLCSCPRTSTCLGQWTGWWCSPASASTSCWCWRSGRSVAATSSSLPSCSLSEFTSRPRTLSMSYLEGHLCHLTWEATPHFMHEGITTAIMNSNCLVFVFSLLWSRRYQIHQASTERLRKSFYSQATRILIEDPA